MSPDQPEPQKLPQLLERRVYKQAGMNQTSYPTTAGTKGPFLVGTAFAGNRPTR